MNISVLFLAIAKEQLIDWVFGDKAVNPGKNDGTRRDYRAEIAEEKYVSDAVKQHRLTPGENLYELMDEI